MRLLLLRDSLVNGGAERQLALLMRCLPDDWERRVWSLGGGPYTEVIRRAGYTVDVRERSQRVDVRPAWDLWSLLVTWRPDVVHSWDWMSSAAALPLCWALGTPLIDGTIRSGVAEPHRLRARKLCMALSARVIANSRAGLDVWGIGPRKGRVVHNGFDPDRLGLCSPRGEKAGLPFTVVMTGRMVPEKDFSSLIAVARSLAEGRPDQWRFLLCGYGPEKPRLVAEAQDLVDLGVVSFVEPGLEVLPVVREAHVGVLLSNERTSREGCSNAIMEYMACGLPVVCCAGGGNGELVVDGSTGYLVPAGDRGRLRAFLEELEGDRSRADETGRRGQERLLRMFSVERMVKAYLEVFAEVLDSSGQRRRRTD